jgi:hypothetical protein
MCLALLFSGVANAATPDEKCANSINKGASKVAKAYAGDAAACIKNAGKGKTDKLGFGCDNAECCLTADAKDKVSKAVSGIKTSDCGGSPPAAIPGLVIDPDDIDVIMQAKDLQLVEAIFGSDLNGVVVVSDKAVSGSKEATKCQAAVIKAVGKCQDAKLASFNACKKDGLKAGDIASAGDLQALCMTPDIPDGKDKISKKCGGDFDLGKKCGSPVDKDALFPGCAPGVDAACIDQKIECEVCKALNALDGLARDCDEFDGPPDDSCYSPGVTAIGSHLAIEDPHAICVGGDNDGGVCSASLIAPYGGECPGGHCIAQAAHSVILNALGWEIPFLLEGATSLDCGVVDPGTGIAPCQCQIESLQGQDISVIGWICLEAVPGLCGPGQVDCDGGSPMDQDLRMHHDAGFVANAQDPNSFPLPFCGLPPDTANANAECEAMCEFYCGTLGPAYEVYESSCEGYCQSGPDGVQCSLHADCPNEDCAGGSKSAPHASFCQCVCIAQGIGSPSRPGAIQCEVGLHTTIEANGPCDELDKTIDITPVCLPVTSETATAIFDYADPGEPSSFDGMTLQGDPGGGCDALITSVTAGSSLVGHSANFDSTIGDVITRNINVYK